jgi:hypothetical protein
MMMVAMEVRPSLPSSSCTTLTSLTRLVLSIRLAVMITASIVLLSTFAKTVSQAVILASSLTNTEFTRSTNLAESLENRT